MRPLRKQSLVATIYIAASLVPKVCLCQAEKILPEGVKAVWDIEQAYRLSTPTREKICINGLWRWQPAGEDTSTVPTGGWGYFKVPGCWPGITNYMQKDSQTVHAHPDWANRDMRGVRGAWYQREITIPSEWRDRRISIRADYVNSHATIHIDGRDAGAIIFPGGKLDITTLCSPGSTHDLSIFIAGLPLKGVMLSYSDTASAKEVAGSVARRGLCGDVYLVGTPAGPRIGDVKVETSVRKWRITLNAALDDLAVDARYTLKARISDQDRNVAEFKSQPFELSDLKNGRITFSKEFKTKKLWDIHTPQNTVSVHSILCKFK